MPTSDPWIRLEFFFIKEIDSKAVGCLDARPRSYRRLFFIDKSCPEGSM